MTGARAVDVQLPAPLPTAPRVWVLLRAISPLIRSACASQTAQDQFV